MAYRQMRLGRLCDPSRLHLIGINRLQGHEIARMFSNDGESGQGRGRGRNLFGKKTLQGVESENAEPDIQIGDEKLVSLSEDERQAMRDRVRRRAGSQLTGSSVQGPQTIKPPSTQVASAQFQDSEEERASTAFSEAASKDASEKEKQLAGPPAHVAVPKIQINIGGRGRGASLSQSVAGLDFNLRRGAGRGAVIDAKGLEEGKVQENLQIGKKKTEQRLTEQRNKSDMVSRSQKWVKDSSEVQSSHKSVLDSLAAPEPGDQPVAVVSQWLRRAQGQEAKSAMLDMSRSRRGAGRGSMGLKQQEGGEPLSLRPAGAPTKAREQWPGEQQDREEEESVDLGYSRWMSKGGQAAGVQQEGTPAELQERRTGAGRGSTSPTAEVSAGVGKPSESLSSWLSEVSQEEQTQAAGRQSVRQQRPGAPRQEPQRRSRSQGQREFDSGERGGAWAGAGAGAGQKVAGQRPRGRRGKRRDGEEWEAGMEEDRDGSDLKWKMVADEEVVQEYGIGLQELQEYKDLVLQVQNLQAEQELTQSFFLMAYEREYLMDVENNPDLDEGPSGSLEAFLESRKEHLMRLDGISTEEDWALAKQRALDASPSLQALVAAYAGPRPLTALTAGRRLAKVAGKLQPAAGTELTAFTQRALQTLKNNPALKFRQKEILLTRVVKSLSQG